MHISNLVQMGGNAITQKSNNKSTNAIVFICLAIFDLLIRSVIVFWGYNTLMPKFVKTLGNSPNNIINFRELSYGEALILVIVVQSLIGN